MHENGGVKLASMRVAGRPLRKTEVLGLLIFVLMAAVMLAVGAGLFYDWLAEPGSAPVGTPVELGPISEILSAAGAVPAPGRPPAGCRAPSTRTAPCGWRAGWPR